MKSILVPVVPIPIPSEPFDIPNCKRSNKKVRKSDDRTSKSNYFVHDFPFFRNSLLNEQDVRLNIPKMFANVLNSGDFEMAHGLFHYICTPSCAFIDSVPKQAVTAGTRPPPAVVYDVDSLIQVVITSLTIFPDLVVRLRRVEYLPSQDMRGTKIILSFAMFGTKTFTYVAEADKNVWPTATFAVNKYETAEGNGPSLEQLQQSAVRHRFNVSPHQIIRDSTPYQALFFPQISLLLNEQKFVTALEYGLTPGSVVVRTPVPLV